MATHSNILAWEIPWTEEPSGLSSPQYLKELDIETKQQQQQQQHSIVCVYHSLFFHLPAEGYLCCFQVLAIMNKTAINIYVLVFV